MAAIVPQYDRRSGYTLLEILVVVTIIGVMASLTIFSLSGNEGRRVQAEAERLQQITQMAADEAIFQKTEMGMVFTPHGYHFMRYNSDASSWAELNIKPFRPYTIPDEMTLTLAEGGKFIPLQGTQPNSKIIPAIVFSSSGEMTAYNLTISAPSAGTSALLIADGIAPITLKMGEEP